MSSIFRPLLSLLMCEKQKKKTDSQYIQYTGTFVSPYNHRGIITLCVFFDLRDKSILFWIGVGALSALSVLIQHQWQTFVLEIS